MPNLGELIGRLVSLVGELLSASSLRLGVLPTLAVLSVMLVLLQLVARPATRWTTRDLGGLAAVPRSMALAAEAGSAVLFSIGTAGVARSASAIGRMQTLGGLPILSHVARAASRGGVPLAVSTNDPVAEIIAAEMVAESHRRTSTVERTGRSRVEYLGEGRAAAAGRALASGEAGAAFVAGSLDEEGLLLLDGLASGSAASSVGTATAGQATSLLLEGEGVLIGPQLYQAPADLRASGFERTMVLAANRLIWIALAVLIIGSLLALAGAAQIGPSLLGAS
ncbi:MAG: hypothetical protein M3R05_05475 [Chloroflexota bacterium]|nr:hypothetical protein [Chloroflexota bacterium]